MALTAKSAHNKDVSARSLNAELQHRHFAVIAAIIHDLKRQHGDKQMSAEDLAHFFAHKLESTNPRFNYARFIAACVS